MSDTIGPGFSIIRSVLHPTDFSEASLVAFNHALKVAMLSQSKFTLLHVAKDRPSAWSEFPGIRETLERWGTLPKGSPRSAVGELGIEASKVMASENEPVDAVMHYLHEHPADLIVLATSQRDGHVRWLGKSVAEPVARKAGEMTLLMPGDVEGFVSSRDGSVNLTKILVPVAETPNPQAAINTAARMVRKLSAPQGTFIVMHVGTANTMPACRYPEAPGWTWDKETRTGEVIGTIVKAAKDHQVGLIVMATDGRNGFLDGIRGSHSERVLRHGAAPLITVPIGSSVSHYLA
ncbi:MAG TPA: universal stress protein [Pyrinomonadaceae bacterium]|nr:universal stress protein [Pyrinomonadaceae bacterium]